MPLSLWNGELQYLVTAVGHSLPDLDAVRDLFKHDNWELVNVEDTEDGHLVTLRVSYFSRIRCIIGGVTVPPKKHTVDGHMVQTDLVFPDVYGCEVTAQERYLEVNVGHDVITRITSDKQRLDDFLDRIQLFGSKASCVCFKNTGHIVVTYMCSMKIQEWQWQLDTIRALITLLSPFKGSLPTSPLPVRDRCHAKCRSRPIHNQSSEDCHTAAHIKVDKLFYVTISKDTFFRDMKTTYPELRFTSHTDQVILEFSGRDDAVKRATQHILNHISSLSECHIQLTDAQAMTMESTVVQNWFQQSLDSQNFLCGWELTSSDRGVPHKAYNRSKRKCIKIVTSNSDPQSDITAFKKIFETCFQTTEVALGNSHVSLLESDSWKQFLDDLQRSSEAKIAPVLKVEQNKIAICDRASNIHHTRRAVLEFFGSNVIDSHPEPFEQEVTEVITDLHPWQIKLLARAQVQKRLPVCLQQTMTVNLGMKTVDIHGLLHTVDKYIIALWKYISSLTATTIELLRKSDTREGVESFLDSTHHICMQRPKDIINSEIEATQQALKSQNRQEEDKQLQTEGISIRATCREQQVDDRPQQLTQQQTGDVPIEVMQTRAEMRQGGTKVHTEKSKLKTKEKLRQTCTGCVQNKTVRTSEYKVQTKKLQKHAQIGHLQRGQMGERNVNTEEKQQRNPGTFNTQQTEDMDMENNHTPTQSQKEMEESRADNTDTQETWRHQQTEEDLSDTDDSPSLQGIPEEGPQLSLTQTVHQTSHELSANSPHPHSPLSSAPSCTGPASPQLSEDPPQSPMVSDARVPPARVRDHCPPDQVQQFRKPRPQRRSRLSAGRPVADTSAGTSLTSSRPAAKRRANAPPSFPQNKRLCGDRRRQQMQRPLYTVKANELTDFSTQAEYQWLQNSPRPVHTISAPVAAAATSNNTGVIINPNCRGLNNSVSKSPQLQASSLLDARLTELQTKVSQMETRTRLSQLENRVLQMERERVQDPVSHSEIRMVNIQHQLGDIKQMLNDIYRQHGDSDSVIMSIVNYSDSVSSPSTSDSSGSEQQQHQQGHQQQQQQ